MTLLRRFGFITKMIPDGWEINIVIGKGKLQMILAGGERRKDPCPEMRGGNDFEKSMLESLNFARNAEHLPPVEWPKEPAK